MTITSLDSPSEASPRTVLQNVRKAPLPMRKPVMPYAELSKT